MEGVRVVDRQNADIADALHLRDVAVPTRPFFGFQWAITSASDTLFDSRGGFSGSSYPMKT